MSAPHARASSMIMLGADTGCPYPSNRRANFHLIVDNTTYVWLRLAFFGSAFISHPPKLRAGLLTNLSFCNV